MKDLNILSSLLAIYIDKPEDAEINFKLGYYYHSINQTASAVSFYLRAAERTDDKLLIYECLLRCSMCFNSQGTRNASVEGMLQHAVSLLPKRPEAYFHLSRLYERTQKWFLGYMVSSIGIGVAEPNPAEKLITPIDYPGFWTLQFEKAVCSWWCGLCEESKTIFESLILNEPLDMIHKESVISNLKKLNGWIDEADLNTHFKSKDEEINNSIYFLDLFVSKDRDKLKYKFDGYESILRNYSETMQDIFVLTALSGKKGGTYLEIGAGFPIFASNTYLLERYFGWKGISLDNKPKFIRKQKLHRNNYSICLDSTKADYRKIVEECKLNLFIDYLQVDCGNSEASYNSLKKVLEDGLKFRVITFSHDSHTDKTKTVKDKSRKLLAKYGYTLFLSNVSHDTEKDYEDWYVDSSEISIQIFKELKNTDNTIKQARKIFIS